MIIQLLDTNYGAVGILLVFICVINGEDHKNLLHPLKFIRLILGFHRIIETMQNISFQYIFLIDFNYLVLRIYLFHPVTCDNVCFLVPLSLLIFLYVIIGGRSGGNFIIQLVYRMTIIWEVCSLFVYMLISDCVWYNQSPPFFFAFFIPFSETIYLSIEFI